MARGTKSEEVKAGTENMPTEKEVAAEKEMAAEETGKTGKKGEEMVLIRLFRDGERYRDDESVTVNGKTTIVPRGKTVMVPKSVAEVLENAMSQRELADLYMEEKEEEYENGLGKLL